MLSITKYTRLSLNSVVSSSRMLTRISTMFNVRPTKDWPWLDAGLPGDPPGFRIDENGEVRRASGPDVAWTLAASSPQPPPTPPAQPTERDPSPPASPPSPPASPPPSRPQGDPPPGLQRWWEREPQTLSPGTPELPSPAYPPALPPWLQDKGILGLPPGVLEAPPRPPEERAPPNP